MTVIEDRIYVLSKRRCCDLFYPKSPDKLKVPIYFLNLPMVSLIDVVLLIYVFWFVLTISVGVMYLISIRYYSGSVALFWCSFLRTRFCENFSFNHVGSHV